MTLNVYRVVIECSLEAIPGKPNFYKNVDSYGGEQMPCAVGTIFNPQGCNCKEDPTLKAKLPPVGMFKMAHNFEDTIITYVQRNNYPENNLYLCFSIFFHH